MEDFFAETIKDFLVYGVERRYFKQRTVEVYEKALTIFFRKIEKPPADVTTTDITRFLAQLAADGKAVNTRRSYQSAIRMFYNWHSQSIGGEDPCVDISPIKEETPMPDILTPGDVAKMILHHRQDELIGRRNAALIALMAGSGLRVSEVSMLNIGSIQLKEKNFAVNVPPMKTKYGRIVPFGKLIESDLVAETFASYFLELKVMKQYRDSTPLFQTYGIFKSATRLQTPGIRSIIHKTAKKCNISGNITPHSFRHFFATYYMHNKGELLELRDLLGHALVETTMRYIHLALTVDDKAIDKYGTSGLQAPKTTSGFVRILKQMVKNQPK